MIAAIITIVILYAGCMFIISLLMDNKQVKKCMRQFCVVVMCCICLVLFIYYVLPELKEQKIENNKTQIKLQIDKGD